jgi:lipopolysaccharide export system permease protein
MMTILDRYLAKTVLLHTLLVMAVLIALMTLVTFIGQQDDIGQGSYDVAGAFLVTLLQMPQQVYQLLPIGALIGAIMGLGGLARDSELTVVRAAGVSVWRIAVSAALAGLVVAAFLWVIGEYFAPPADQYARQYKIFSRYSQLEFTGSRSAWVRQGPLFINVRRQAAENLYGGVYVYRLDDERRLTLVARAETATQDETGRWVLSNYAETQLLDDHVAARTLDRLVTDQKFNADFLGVAVTQPGLAAARGPLCLQGAPEGQQPRVRRVRDRVLGPHLAPRRGRRRLRVRRAVCVRAAALGGRRRAHRARHHGGRPVRADHPDTGEQRGRSMG